MRRLLVRSRYLGAPLRLAYRGRVALGELVSITFRALRWVLCGREISNYTYPLTEENERYLLNVMGGLLGVEPQRVADVYRELTDDSEFRRSLHVMACKRKMAHLVDETISFNRRLIYYLAIRVLRPSVIFESGIERGLGSALIKRAMDRNRAEGHPSSYTGVDIRGLEESAFIDATDEDENFRITTGASEDVLEQHPGRIDCFIHDTCPDPEHEAVIFSLLRGKLAERFFAYSSWQTIPVLELANALHARIVPFTEVPASHWYRGARIALMVRDGKRGVV